MKKRVLFVGAFKEKGKEGNVGGQMYACRTLIESELSKDIEWILIDSTADSNISISFFIRLLKAINRIVKLIYHLCFSKIDKVLIFTSNGFSFMEKGVMALLSKSFRRFVIIAPRSGFIINDLRRSGFLRKFIPFIFNKVDFIICQGEAWHSFFLCVIPNYTQKLIIVNNWIDISKYTRANLAAPKHEVIILYMAWVDENKGIFDLIEAAKNLVNNATRIKFIIAGKGKDFGKAIEVAKKDNLEHFFDFKGWVTGDEKIKLLSQSDIFILPSYAEGFPNVLLEAMAAGLPIIATDVGSIKDVVLNSQNGYLVSPKNIEQITGNLKILIENKNKRIEFGDKSFEIITQKGYSIHNAVAKFQNLLK